MPELPPDLAVLFEDNHCLALAKPAGLLTQGVPPGVPTLEAQARDYLRTRYHKTGRVYLGIPHRLDRPVSGVVLFARSSKAAARLAEQFAQRQVTKVYWALVEANPAGELPPEAGHWDDWLLKIAAEARTEVAAAETPGASGVADLPPAAGRRRGRPARTEPDDRSHAPAARADGVARLADPRRRSLRRPSAVRPCGGTAAATGSSPCTRGR